MTVPCPTCKSKLHSGPPLTAGEVALCTCCGHFFEGQEGGYVKTKPGKVLIVGRDMLARAVGRHLLSCPEKSCYIRAIQRAELRMFDA